MGTLTPETIHRIQSADIDHLRKQPAKSIDNITEKIDYEQFFLNYLIPNRPCVFGCHVTDTWRSIQEWVSEKGTPNMDFLASHFGDAVVPVADCNKMQYYAQPKTDMMLLEYVQYWKDHISNDHTSENGCLYLKDWHFANVFPDYLAYETPVFFTSDWLNEFWDARSDRSDDDYRFVYMGPKGSWTPFHADVFRSFSWSANICGRKKWLLFPPGEEDHLRDHLGNLAYDVTSSEMHDGKKYPHYGKACKPLEVVQEAGEVIFVPSGWHHQVFNLEDTISINHNWLNGCNVDIMWNFLQQELCTVQRSISDCKDMDGWNSQCQLIMKASTGIDYSEFFQFLHTIATRRLNALKRSHQGEENPSALKVPDQHDAQSNLKQVVEPSTNDKFNIASIQCKHCEPLISNSGRVTGDQRSDVASSPAQFTSETEFQDTTSKSTIQRTLGLCVWHAVFDLGKIKQVLECLISNKDFQELDETVLCDDPRSLQSRVILALEEYYQK